VSHLPSDLIIGLSSICESADSQKPGPRRERKGGSVSSALLGQPPIVITLYTHATRPLALPDRLATNYCSRKHVVPTWKKLDINLSVQYLFDFLHSTSLQCRDGPRGTIHVTGLTKGCRFRLDGIDIIAMHRRPTGVEGLGCPGSF